MRRMLGNVVLAGAHLLSEKMVALIEQLIAQEPDCRPSAVVIRDDGRPVGCFGKAYIDAQAITINLEEIWQKSVKNMADAGYYLNIRAAVWFHVLTTVGHEIQHLLAALVDREAFDKMKEEELDKDADEWAIENLARLAKKYDVEPVALENEPFFGPRLMQLSVGGGMGDRTRIQMEQGIVYEDAVNNVCMNSFREYVRALVGGEEDKEWEVPTVGVSVTYTMGDGTKVEAAAEAPLPVAEAQSIPVAAPIAMAASAEALAPAIEPTEGATFYANMSEIPDDVESLIEAAVQAESQGHVAPVEVAQVAVPQFVAPVAAAPVVQPVAQKVGEETIRRDYFRTEEDYQYALKMAQMRAELPTKAVLPGAVQAVQNVVMTAPNMTAAPVLTATQYPPNTIAFAAAKACADELFMICYANMFNRCGWQGANGGGFTQAAEVLKPIDVSSVLRKHGCEGFVMEYKTLNSEGQATYEKAMAGQIRGLVTPKINLPSYELCFNFQGTKITRTVLAQNPQKRQPDGSFSKSAVLAQQGNAIAWVIDTDSRKFKFEIKNNNMRELG